MILLAALLAGASAPAAAATPAADVADVSTRVCYGLASGGLVLPPVAGPADLEAQFQLIESQGLQASLDDETMNGLGPAGSAMISRATLGSRANGTARIVLAAGGAMPGCRTILVADADPSASGAVAAALAQAGWREVTAMAATRGGIERRAFLRRDAGNRPYLLNLMTPTAAAPASGRLRLFTTVVAIPPHVSLPEGF